MTNSPTYQLADDRIDGGLEEFVRERRRTGLSWRRITQALYAETGVDLTHETLRAWFIDREWAQSKPRSRHTTTHTTTPPGRRGRPRRRPLDQVDRLFE